MVHASVLLDQLCQTALGDFGKLELWEKIFLGLLQINHVTPLGFSQQFEAQRSLPEKVFYVAGCRRCCFIFNVEATLRAHQEEWISVEILVCPPKLLAQVRQALPCSPAAVPWLSSLQAIAEDPTESSRGLLGHFSSTQMDFIESLFMSLGEPDPWGSIINPIWALIWPMWRRERAWDRATEPNPDLTSGEPPISPQLYQTEAPLEDVLSPQLVESLGSVLAPLRLESVPVVTMPGDRRRVLVEEAPSEGEVLSPLKLLLNGVAVLGSFPLKFLFSFLPTSSWSK